MASSSPVGSSPSKHFNPPSKRYVSKVYSRRPTLGQSVPAPKRAKRTPTPESGTESDGDGEAEKAILENGDEVILGERESDSDDEVVSTQPVKSLGKPQTKAKLGLPATRQAPAKVVKAAKGKNGTVKVEKPGAKPSPIPQEGPPRKEAPPVPITKAVQARGSKRKSDIIRTDTEISISSAPDIPSPVADVPPITVQPATSSPSIPTSSQAHPPVERTAPSTPPRKKPKRNAPLTPHSSSPRDLSALFAPVSPARSPALSRRNTATDELGSGDGGQAKRAGTGLFRRMLDKTQSLGAIASPSKSNEGDAGTSSTGFGEGDFVTRSPSGPSNLARTHSLPTTPSKSPVKDELPTIGQSLIVPVASSSRLEITNLGSGGKGKRTYGRSRTILAEANESPRSGASSAAGDRDVVKESYAELRKQFEVDNSGEDTGSGNLMLDLLAVRGGQSVSDLRSKGENRRFMDELGYLVDPIMDSGTSIGLKRSSIYDILRSMQDEEWLNRAKICGQVEQIWEAIYGARGDGDEIVEAMCLLYLVNLVKSGSGLELILRSHDETCERILLASLKVRDGPLDEAPRVKPVGTVLKFRSMYQQLELGWTSNSMSTRRIASFLLMEITSPAIRPPASCTSLLSTEKGVSRIVKSLATDVGELAARFDLVEKGLPLILVDRKTEIDIDHLSQSLVVVSRLVAHGLSDRQVLAEMYESAVPVIVNSLIAGLYLALNDTALTELGSSMTIQSLQILATMSNFSSDWSNAIPGLDGALTALARVLLQRSNLTSASGASSADAHPENDLEDPVHDEDEEARFFSPKKGKQRATSPRSETIGEEDVLCLVLVVLMASLGSTIMTEKLATLRIDSTCKGSRSCLRVCTCPNAESFAAHLVNTYIHHKNSEAPTASLIAAYVALILAKLILSRHDLLDLFPGHKKHENLSDLIEVLSDLKGLQSLLHTRLKVAAGVVDGEVGDEDVAMEGDEGVVNGAIEDLRRLADEMRE